MYQEKFGRIRSAKPAIGFALRGEMKATNQQATRTRSSSTAARGSSKSLSRFKPNL